MNKNRNSASNTNKKFTKKNVISAILLVVLLLVAVGAAFGIASVKTEAAVNRAGVYSIYAKSTGVYLVGETWNSYVNYWMPFKGGYGLHDASWRSEFGGDIYLYDGSHGCVNTPYEKVKYIYEHTDYGTPVYVY